MATIVVRQEDTIARFTTNEQVVKVKPVTRVVKVVQKNVVSEIVIGTPAYMVQAGEAINSHTPVGLINGMAYRYDAGNIAHLMAFAGWTKTSVLTGGMVEIVQAGELNMAGWGLTAGVHYSAGLNGAVHAGGAPAGALFRKIVGYASTATKMLVHKDNNPTIKQ